MASTKKEINKPSVDLINLAIRAKFIITSKTCESNSCEEPSDATLLQHILHNYTDLSRRQYQQVESARVRPEIPAEMYP